MRVSESHAGREGTCPKCRSALVVPDSQVVADLLTPNSRIDVPQASEKPHYNLTFLDNPQPIPPPTDCAEAGRAEEDNSDALLLSAQAPMLGSVRHEPEPIPQRKLPWIIDIFLYPTSRLSLVILALFAIVPIAIRILVLSTGPFMLITLWPGWLVIIFFYLYAFWYYSSAIRQSAEGKLRAPNEITDVPGMWEMLVQLGRAAACLLVFFLPALIYLKHAQARDTVFWMLFGSAALLFPMGFLAVNVFDSLRGLNPAVIVPSIYKTFLPYCCLALIHLGIGRLLAEIGPYWQRSREMAYISLGGIFYLMLVSGHLLGRLYFRYEEKLNWDA
ncbi:MAG: hypothetical protein JW720_04625 [Sedimentisphaerales bacterium]|nr:hypothetical protein [Sedimentisphaerales bacterium]